MLPQIPTLHCPHCGHDAPLEKWQPVERYYELGEVAKLLNTTPGFLRKWICTEPYLRAYPQLYRKRWNAGVLRVLPESMVWKMLAWRARKYL
jgi:hypothetical protein